MRLVLVILAVMVALWLIDLGRAWWVARPRSPSTPVRSGGSRPTFVESPRDGLRRLESAEDLFFNPLLPDPRPLEWTPAGSPPPSSGLWSLSHPSWSGGRYYTNPQTVFDDWTLRWTSRPLVLPESSDSRSSIHIDERVDFQRINHTWVSLGIRHFWVPASTLSRRVLWMTDGDRRSEWHLDDDTLESDQLGLWEIRCRQTVTAAMSVDLRFLRSDQTTTEWSLVPWGKSGVRDQFVSIFTGVHYSSGGDARPCPAITNLHGPSGRGYEREETRRDAFFPWIRFRLDVRSSLPSGRLTRWLAGPRVGSRSSPPSPWIARWTEPKAHRGRTRLACDLFAFC